MSSGSRSSLVRQFRTLFEAGTVAGLTDGQFLERFLAGRDDGGEVAFEALVARHGPMVLGVCRRALADPNDAADAFQATFLVLVRKARSIRVDDSLGRWLYGVSRRVASRARASAAGRPRTVDGEIDAIEARSTDPDRFELASLLDEELARLPESFRSALVLCDLEGLTHEEAARDLRCPVGTIKSRLSRGRERLRVRLARRGLSPASMMVAPVVPALLSENAVRASMLSVGSYKSAVGVVSASAVALAEGVLKSMSGIKVKLALAAVLSISVISSGAVVLAQGQKKDLKHPVPAQGRVEERPDADPQTSQARRGRAKLEQELSTARYRLEQLSRMARDPKDPAIVRARKRFDDLQRDINQIELNLPDAREREFEPTIPPGRKTWPGRGAELEPPGELSKVSMSDYVVEPPDIIVVEVLEALPGRPITGERLVGPDGKINLGFYGEVYVSGLTTTEIKAKIALHLREFLNDDTLGLTRVNPETLKVEPVAPTRTHRLFVDIAAYNSKVYYVQGDVGSPGRLAHTGNETVLDAINFAGGLLPTASKYRIRLVRPSPPGSDKETTLFVDFDAIINQGQTKTNYQLLPGDRLIVDKDPKVAIEAAKAANLEKSPPSDVEARLQTVERKLDEVLKALERLPKP